MTKEFLTVQHWMEFLILNVDGRMSDSEFRDFVRHNIPTVIGHELAHKGLVERGRLPVERKVRVTEPKEDFRDRPAQRFMDK